MHDKEFKSLMINMLNKNTISRLFKYDMVVKHPWFSNFDWEKLINLAISPPYSIKMKKKEENNIDLLKYLEVLNKINIEKT